MKEILEKQLFYDFPLLYDQQVDVDPLCRGFNFDCGDGWYYIIQELSQRLYPLVAKCRDFDSNPMVSQVYQKNGSLMFDMAFATDEMCDLITEYEDLSGITCEICGEDGELRYLHHHYVTRCDKHKDVYDIDPRESI